MLKKIDCVMIRVADLEAATAYYSEVFGLRPLWRDELSVRIGLPQTDAEIVLHCIPDLPNPVDVHTWLMMLEKLFDCSEKGAARPWSNLIDIQLDSVR